MASDKFAEVGLDLLHQLRCAGVIVAFDVGTILHDHRFQGFVIDGIKGLEFVVNLH